jgi:nickel/cobalt transporter (NicO) family protein
MESHRKAPSQIAVDFVAAVLAAVSILLCLDALDVALAQGPFGLGGADSPSAASPGGFTGWLLAKQAGYYREFTGLIRAAKSDHRAVYALLGVSFAYGIFHAAGPGHGKAVISSYLVANRETWRRGVILSFASALLQALVAVVVVGVAAVLLGGTAKMMGSTVRVIEIASYLLIIAIGVRLTWIKGREFFSALRNVKSVQSFGGEEIEQEIRCAHHDHAHNEQYAVRHFPNAHPAHTHHHGRGGVACDHSHGPDPEELAGEGGWRRGLSAVLAVGLRPCSGAILVLVFTLAQGLFWSGVAATFVMGLGTAITVAAIATLAVGAATLARRLAPARSGWGTVGLRAIEVGAALVIAAFGLLLLAGFMVSEQLQVV